MRFIAEKMGEMAGVSKLFIIFARNLLKLICDFKNIVKKFNYSL